MGQAQCATSAALASDSRSSWKTRPDRNFPACMGCFPAFADIVQLVEVTVSSLSGDTRTIQLPADATGKDIKHAVWREWAVPEMEQQLACGTTVLQDDSQPLGSCHPLLLQLVRVRQPEGQHHGQAEARDVGRGLQVRRNLRSTRIGSARLVGRKMMHMRQQR
eukprot:gb/GFBE01048505.1/.p1 GENE.gb/GFBE01048505.1/~~gb/GFBE01048505.1/.p1  ORF type:complete len:163 (+),score=16.34 gb/GFBE01048505.1/:1-489(+)